MTIALGFHCRESVILGADTEITGFVGKWQREKIRNVIWTPEIGIATVFAGSVEYALMACDKILPRVLDSRPEISSIVDAIEKTIQEIYAGPIASLSDAREGAFSLLIAIRILSEDFVHLIKASDTAVRRGDAFESVGSGNELARYIGSKLFRGGMPAEEGALLAAYILHEAKHNVVGCGGSSLILGLEPSGIKMVSSEKLDTLEKCFDTTRMPADSLPIKMLKDLGPILEGAVSG
jgi:hypothetical protein